MIKQIPVKYKKYDQDLCKKHGLPNHPTTGKCPMCLINEPIEDKRPISVKSGVTGCMNCNVRDCKNGSKYEKFPGTNSDACKNRVFAGDTELYTYVSSQHD